VTAGFSSQPSAHDSSAVRSPLSIFLPSRSSDGANVTSHAMVRVQRFTQLTFSPHAPAARVDASTAATTARRMAGKYPR